VLAAAPDKARGHARRLTALAPAGGGENSCIGGSLMIDLFLVFWTLMIFLSIAW